MLFIWFVIFFRLMSLRRLYILAVDIAADAGNEDNKYGRDAEQPYSQRTGNGYPAVSKSDLGTLSQLERRHGYESHNSRTYAAEYGRNNLVVLKLMEENLKNLYENNSYCKYPIQIIKI